MKYVISHYQQQVGALGKSKRIAVVNSAEAAIVMAAALATDMGKHRGKTDDGLADSIHVTASPPKGMTGYGVACFLCERDRFQDIIGAMDAADRLLKKWKADQKAARERHEWMKAHVPPAGRPNAKPSDRHE